MPKRYSFKMPNSPERYIARAIIFTIAGLTVAACETTAALKPAQSLIPAPKSGRAISPINVNTEHFIFGDYSSSAWISDSFTGQHERQFHGNTLSFGVLQTAPEGGLDVGLSRAENSPAPVSQAIKNLRMCSSYMTDLSGTGRWWAGPKISVNWQGDEAAKQNGDDWYENYIVEIASSSPDELHDIFMGDYFKGEELPSTKLAGSSYRHYKIRFHSWWQFWSVRQVYRENGTLPIAPIVEVWIDNGLPTHRLFDGVKANIETYGAINGNGQLRMNITTDPAETLSCE